MSIGDKMKIDAKGAYLDYQKPVDLELVCYSQFETYAKVYELSFKYNGVEWEVSTEVSMDLLLPVSDYEMKKLLVNTIADKFKGEFKQTIDPKCSMAHLDAAHWTVKAFLAKTFKYPLVDALDYSVSQVHAVYTPSVSSHISEQAKKLPSIHKRVPSHKKCKCYNDAPQEMFDHIIHLNDDHALSREEIADWLDELHDNGIVNIEFQPWEEDPLAAEEEDYAKKLYEEASTLDEWPDSEYNEHSGSKIKKKLNGE